MSQLALKSAIVEPKDNFNSTALTALGSKIKFYDGFKNFLKLLCLFQVIDKTY